MIADTGRYAGLVMQLHDDGIGANFWVDKRVNQWSTRRRSRQKQSNDEINELESSDGVPKVRFGDDGASITGQKFETPGEGEESKMLLSIQLPSLCKLLHQGQRLGNLPLDRQRLHATR